jgi:hypothetical protein
MLGARLQHVRAEIDFPVSRENSLSGSVRRPKTTKERKYNEKTITQYRLGSCGFLRMGAGLGDDDNNDHN